MTLHRLAELSAYWNNHPPTHVIAAKIGWVLGIKPENPGNQKEAETVPEFAQLPEYEEGAGE